MLIRIFLIILIGLNVGGCTTWKSRVKKDCKWVYKTIKYTPEGDGEDYLQSCEETLQRGKGDCEDFSHLTAYLLEMKGYKVEEIVVWYYNPLNEQRGKHACVRVYKNGKPWIVDTSGYKIIIQKEKITMFTIHRYMFLKLLADDFYYRGRLKIIER